MPRCIADNCTCAIARTPVTQSSQVAVPALQINAKDLLFGESILHGDYWPRYHTYLRKGDRAWNIIDAV